MHRRSNNSGRQVFDAAALEASFLQNRKVEEDVIEFDDELNEETFGIATTAPVVMPKAVQKNSYAATVAPPMTATNSHYSPKSRAVMTVEEIEAQLASGMSVSPQSPVSHLIGAGPPPGLMSGQKPAASESNSLLSGLKASSGPGAPYLATSSVAPLPRDDVNRGFMNRFERELIQRIHTHQLTTDNPHMDDFYYQSLNKKRASSSTANSAPPLLYFPLPSVADREREFQRRQQRRARRERELAAKEGRELPNNESAASLVTAKAKDEALDLVLGKVSHSSSRKPRQQLQIPSSIADESAGSVGVSLHERVLKSIELIYGAVLAVEDFYLRAEGHAAERGELRVDPREIESLAGFDELVKASQACITQELGLTSEAIKEEVDHPFIHLLTIPKGKSIMPRALKLLPVEQREGFLNKLVRFFDFLDVVRPETPVSVVDTFISSVLSPLVGFVGEAEWSTVLTALLALFAKRSFVWIALTKAGMVLLCILFSRVEILKATSGGEDAQVADVEEAAKLTEKIFDALEGHLAELFTVRVADNREFYAWQFLALLAMNVDSDRKRNMILELRDMILTIVESGEESSINNLNVFLNALGLDASQLA